jgi:hypothetical protein
LISVRSAAVANNSAADNAAAEPALHPRVELGDSPGSALPPITTNARAHDIHQEMGTHTTANVNATSTTTYPPGDVNATSTTTTTPLAGGALERYPPTIVWKDTALDWFRFTLDSDAPATFKQRILYSDHFWDNSTRDGPLLIFFGGEGTCEDFYNNSGALFEMASSLSAKVRPLSFFGQNCVSEERHYSRI